MDRRSKHLSSEERGVILAANNTTATIDRIALRGPVVAAKALPTDLIAWLCLKYGVALRSAVVAAKALSTDWNLLRGKYGRYSRWS